MPYDLNEPLVIGISSRALFNLEEENKIYEEKGLTEYEKYQVAHEDEILAPGSGFGLVEAFLGLNKLQKDKRLVEVIVMSRNSPNTSLRIFNSIKEYGLDITRAALSGGQSITPYLKAFKTDLFLSANTGDVQKAINDGIAAGVILTGSRIYKTTKSARLTGPNGISETAGFTSLAKTSASDRLTGPDNTPAFSRNSDQIRIAFDGDAVLFSAEAEKIYHQRGLEAFAEHEKENAAVPLNKGPFANFLMTISHIQNMFADEKRYNSPIRTALVTSRNAPSHERAIRTLRSWGVHVDEAFFLGGVPKKEILSAFGANIFFDDQHVHADPASEVVPAAIVPYRPGENPEE